MAKIYALYKGDEYVTDGTLEEIADKTGRKLASLEWMLTPTAKKRAGAGSSVLVSWRRDKRQEVCCMRQGVSCEVTSEQEILLRRVPESWCKNFVDEENARAEKILSSAGKRTQAQMRILRKNICRESLGPALLLEAMQ